MNWDALWINARLVTCENGYGLIDDAAIAVQAGKISWLGNMAALPAAPEKLANEVHDVKGACITPGFIDCHTHLVYGGNRAQEFERRLQGESYTSIAKSGGGIQATVNATRMASEDELYAIAYMRIQQMMRCGMTAVEIKSGYGLDLATELKLLRVIRRLKQTLPITIKATFLGAHVVPPEFSHQPDAYIDYICTIMLPAIAKEQLADAMDVFCESIAFSLPQTERLFKAAQQYQLPIKCHAEQLSHTGATALAATYQALSADHLEYMTVDDVKALRAANTVAVLLPGAFYFLRETKMPPIDLLRKNAIPMALATDANPGTSPIFSLLFILNMACTLFQFTPEEALLGVTKHAAAALKLDTACGTLTVGKRADFNIWSISHPAELTYYVGLNLLQKQIIAGKIMN